MDKSTENAPKILYDTRLYRELYDMWKVYRTAITHCSISDVIAEVSKILSERMTAMLTSIMKDLPICDGCKSLILMEDDPNLCKKKFRQDDTYCFAIMWHSSGIMYMDNYTYQYFLSYIDKKEKEFINGLLNHPDSYKCSLTNGFDYEFEKVKSDEDIAQTAQENAQSEISKELCNKICMNARRISDAYGNYFSSFETPLITRYTLLKVHAMHDQHTTRKTSSIDFIKRFTDTSYTSEQKIISLLKQINDAEKLIATMPAIYTKFDEFKQHITDYIVQLMLDKEDSDLSLKKQNNSYYDNWTELKPIANLYPGLMDTDTNKYTVITPGARLYNLKESILAKYKKLARQTLQRGTICKSTATIFVPTEQYADSVLQDITAPYQKDIRLCSMGDIARISIPIAKTYIPYLTTNCYGKFDVNRYHIMRKLFNVVRPIYEENPDDRERIENCIRATIDDIMDNSFADPNSAEFKQYIETCKTCIANVKANVMAIKDALLSSDDTDFIEYLYESKHIYKREYDARIKQIEEQNNEVTV